MSSKNGSDIEMQTNFENHHGTEHSSCLKIEKMLRESLRYLCRLDAAGDTLSTIRNFNDVKKLRFIEDFFTNLFVWGCIAEDNNSDKIMTHKEISKRLKDLEENLSNIINSSIINYQRSILQT